MEDEIALAMVSGGLFIAILLIFNRATSKGTKMRGRQLLRYAALAGVSSVAAKYLLAAKFQPAVTVFKQDPPF